MLCYNINHVLNRQENKSAEPIATVPKKGIFLVLPFLGSQSEVLARRVKSCVSKFYGFVNLRVIFNNTCRIKSFFPYKDRISRSQRSKVVQCIGLIVGTAILSTSVKRNDDYMIGRLNILRGEKLNYKSVAKEISKPPFFGS